jgi:hypothetical protein
MPEACISWRLFATNQTNLFRVSGHKWVKKGPTLVGRCGPCPTVGSVTPVVRISINPAYWWYSEILLVTNFTLEYRAHCYHPKPTLMCSMPMQKGALSQIGRESSLYHLFLRGNHGL